MAKKRTSKVIMIKPSKLPKTASTTVRYNPQVKQLLKDKGYSLQALLDEAIDRKLHKVEVKTELTIETKK